MIKQKKSFWDDIYQNKSIPLLAERQKQLRLCRQLNLMQIKFNEEIRAHKIARELINE